MFVNNNYIDLKAFEITKSDTSDLLIVKSKINLIDEEPCDRENNYTSLKEGGLLWKH